MMCQKQDFHFKAIRRRAAARAGIFLCAIALGLRFGLGDLVFRPQPWSMPTKAVKLASHAALLSR